ncbi:MAG: diguanylate cyclase, partial [Chromatiaceae bacterium]
MGIITSEGIPEAEREGTWSGEAALFAAGGTEIPVALRIIAHYDEDGAVRFFSTTMQDRSRYVYEEGGNAAAMASMASDVTRCKRIEARLLDGERILRDVVDGTLAGFWDWNLLDNTEYLSPAFKRTFGYEDHEMESSPEAWQRIIFPEDLPCVLESIDRHVKSHGREPFCTEVRYRHKNGSTVWVICMGQIVDRLEDGSPTRMAGVHVNITERIQMERALSRTQSVMAQAEDLAALGSFEWDIKTDTWMLSDAWKRIHGVSETHLTTQQLLPVAHPEDEPLIEAHFRKAVENGELYDIAHRIIRQDTGEIRYVHARGVINLDDAGEPAALIGAVQDITERNRAEEGLRLADRVFQAADEGIMVTDMQGRIVAVNPAFTRISGYTEEDALGQTPALLHSGQQDAGFYKGLWRNLLELGHWRGEIWNRRKNGDVYPGWLTISAVRNDDGEITQYVGMFSDISQIKKAQQQMEFMAHYDSLTGLANRVLLKDRLKQALRRAERKKATVTLLFLDLDRFKTINDTLGHNLGDLLLQTVAQRMKDTVRASDTLSRLGGDEFVLLLEDGANAQEISRLCQKLLSVLETPMLLEGHELVITASIGLATYPDDGEDADALLKNADLAMYAAKGQGRNAYEFFAPSLSEGIVDRLKIESDLRGAAARNELRVHYQPQVRLSDGSLLGVEALVRWEHPTLGLVSPGRFIPLAEEMGMIGDISAWVLREACRQMRAWRDEGREVSCVAVNLSVQQLERQMLVNMVRECLEAYDLPADCLELEVTESLIMRAPEKAQSVLQKLKL